MNFARKGSGGISTFTGSARGRCMHGRANAITARTPRCADSLRVEYASRFAPRRCAVSSIQQGESSARPPRQGLFNRCCCVTLKRRRALRIFRSDDASTSSGIVQGACATGVSPTSIELEGGAFVRHLLHNIVIYIFYRIIELNGCFFTQTTAQTIRPTRLLL